MEAGRIRLVTVFPQCTNGHVKVKDEIDLTGLFLGKGVGKTATVKFGYDGTAWPIPNEFGFHAQTR